jgi:hypothetical protein
MKVYVGNRTFNDESFKMITEPEILSYIAEDSECTTIVLDNTLTKLKFNDVISTVNMAVNKLRTNGILIINDIDFDLLTYLYTRNPNLQELNNLVSGINGFKSFLSSELIKDMMKNFPNLSLGGATLNNLEFKLEYIRDN